MASHGQTLESHVQEVFIARHAELTDNVIVMLHGARYSSAVWKETHSFTAFAEAGVWCTCVLCVGW